MLITAIAKEASVSPATVSRAVNRPEIVAPATLARIRSVMEKHNYVPSPVARRRGPKAGFEKEIPAPTSGATQRDRAPRLDLIELVRKSVDFFQFASVHQANGGALILRHPDGREERLLLF